MIVSLGLLTQQAGEDFIRAGAFLAVGAVLWLVNRRAEGVEPDAAQAARPAAGD